MSGIQNLVNNVKSQSLKVAEYFTPLLKDSKFHETGVLTPEEFVAAGDHLAHHCPSWRWATGDAAAAKDYLPKEKQFLVTRNVPCYKRCAQMMADVSGASVAEKLVEAEEGEGCGGADDGWVDTHHFASEEDQAAEKVRDMSLGDEKKANTLGADATVRKEEEEDDSDQEAVGELMPINNT